MQMDWDKLFRRYVADDVKTPYFVRVEHLTQKQANSELFVYTLFMCVLFGAVGLASISTDLPHKGALGVPVYALAVVCAAIMLGMSRHPWAAAFCATAPVAAMMYFLLFGFHPNLGNGDKTLLIVIVLLWLRYSFRILSIVRTQPGMPPG